MELLETIVTVLLGFSLWAGVIAVLYTAPVQLDDTYGIISSPTKEAHVAIKTYRCRFYPNHAPTPGRGELTEYLVPVQWWAYDDDRLDGRGDAKLTKAQVEVKAYSPKEARKLVVLEWGSYGKVGTPAEVTA